MFDIYKQEIEWAGRTLTLETGNVARQADGAVMVTYGDTTILATVVAAKSAKSGQDFFPLTVNYQEKAYAAGKIPGGYFKREGRPTERETLICRLIDRPIRPLFVDGFKNETQVVITVLSHDLENDPDIPALIGASAALTISGIPFMGPIGATKVGYKDGEYVINPTIEEIGEGELELVVAGTHDAVLMVESEAKELTEEVMLGAVMAGHTAFQPVLEAIVNLAEKCAKAPREMVEVDNSEIEAKIATLSEEALRAAYTIQTKAERYTAVGEAKSIAMAEFADFIDGDVDRKLTVAEAFKGLEKKIVRGNILSTGKRIDGRDLSTVRGIEAQVGILPRAHGTSLFTRGETQAIVVATLGTGDDVQYVDELTGTRKESFMLHYNFPPYSVGEAGRMGGTSRREIGHGKLAWRAIHPLLPSQEDFPYTIRVVSEITESNGSSSMASVCGTSLALMDAGVPLERPVSGIAMGLIKEGDEYAVLSDILGDEDHLGDMDFKVAGTIKGLTSLQMDIKIGGITEEIMGKALEQAKGGRHHILEEMAKALDTTRDEMGEFAPRIETIQIPTDKIREVIGAGGKVIREIVEQTGAKINIDDDGIVKVASSDAASIEAAMDWIKGIAVDPEVGTIFDGTVVKVMEYGAFVNFYGSKDGLVHKSQISNDRIENVADHLSEGQKIKVKLVKIDDRGKMSLSLRDVDQDAATEGDAE
ncbi:MAG: polyribonucleotide nucleotidyltransferase [Hyphomicrobiales bacterium]